MTYSLLLGLLAGFFIANYGWQLWHDRLWMVAFERTYYQGVALGCVGLLHWMRP